MKYPHLVTGAIAASAPVHMFPGMIPCEVYHRIVTSSFGIADKECVQNIRKSWKVIRFVFHVNYQVITLIKVSKNGISYDIVVIPLFGGCVCNIRVDKTKISTIFCLKPKERFILIVFTRDATNSEFAKYRIINIRPESWPVTITSVPKYSTHFVVTNFASAEQSAIKTHYLFMSDL